MNLSKENKNLKEQATATLAIRETLDKFKEAQRTTVQELRRNVENCKYKPAERKDTSIPITKDVLLEGGVVAERCQGSYNNESPWAANLAQPKDANAGARK